MTAQALAVSLVTPRAMLVDGEATQAVLPTAEGQITVLPQHATYLGALACGVVTFVGSEGVPQRFFVAEGFVEADATRVVVLADRAQSVEDIDVARAERALVGAETRLAQLSGPEHPDYVKQRARRERALGRIAAARQD